MIKNEKRSENGSLRERIRAIEVRSNYITHTGSETTQKCGENSVKTRKSTGVHESAHRVRTVHQKAPPILHLIAQCTLFVLGCPLNDELENGFLNTH